jgi:DNA-binding beta-propeller fold protein YncE
LLATSYNQPKLCFNASWNPNAITIANKILIGLEPAGIYVNTENTIYVADRQNGRVLEWYHGSSTPTRNISGNLSSPWSLFVTMHGDIYVDNGDLYNRVDKWMLTATNSEPVMNIYGSCRGLFIDINDTLYCSSMNGHRVVKVKLNSEPMTPITVAGTSCPGPVSDMLNHPQGIFVDINFYLHVADSHNNRIQRFALGALNAETVAGFGGAGNFILNRPTGIVLDADKCLFIVDSHNHRIIRSTPYGFRCLVGCSGGSGALSSQLHNPHTLALDSIGNMFVSDLKNHRIQKFSLASKSCGTSI